MLEAWLSEEGDAEDSAIGTWRTFWCIDPLDGTKDFVKGLSEYTVNIAIVEDASPVLGVIDVTVQDVMYYGAKGLGAWKVSSSSKCVMKMLVIPVLSEIYAISLPSGDHCGLIFCPCCPGITSMTAVARS